MKLKLVTAIAISAMAILSCSEDTGTIGTSLTFESALLDLAADIFKAYSSWRTTRCLIRTSS